MEGMTTRKKRSSLVWISSCRGRQDACRQNKNPIMYLAMASRLRFNSLCYTIKNTCQVLFDKTKNFTLGLEILQYEEKVNITENQR